MSRPHSDTLLAKDTEAQDEMVTQDLVLAAQMHQVIKNLRAMGVGSSSPAQTVKPDLSWAWKDLIEALESKSARRVLYDFFASHPAALSILSDSLPFFKALLRHEDSLNILPSVLEALRSYSHLKTIGMESHGIARYIAQVGPRLSPEQLSESIKIMSSSPFNRYYYNLKILADHPFWLSTPLLKTIEDTAEKHLIINLSTPILKYYLSQGSIQKVRKTLDTYQSEGVPFREWQEEFNSLLTILAADALAPNIYTKDELKMFLMHPYRPLRVTAASILSKQHQAASAKPSLGTSTIKSSL